jgi:ribosome-binding factor A
MVKSRFAGSGPSQRQLRVGELVRHALSDIFRNGAHMETAFDTRLLTITEVKMSPDLKIATVFVMPLGGKGAGNVTRILGDNVRLLRGEMGHRLDLKFTPNLRFLVDESFAEGARIDALLRSPFVKQDIGKDGDGE